MSAVAASFARMSLQSSIPAMTPAREIDCAPLLSRLPECLKEALPLVCDYVVPTKEAVTRLARILFAEGSAGLADTIQACQCDTVGMQINFADRELQVRVPENASDLDASNGCIERVAEVLEALQGVTLRVAPTLRVLRGDTSQLIEVTALKITAIQSLQMHDTMRDGSISLPLLHNSYTNFRQHVHIAREAEVPQTPLAAILAQPEEPDS